MKSNRREFIQSIGTGLAGLGLAAPLGLTSCTDTDESVRKEDGQILFIGDEIAVAETTNGKVKGYILKDIYHFLGIPYGADTSGKNRFMPPQKPEPWTDIYPAVWYGNSTPQDLTNRWRSKLNTFRCHWYFDDVSENCLSIDVYTPGINDNKKRPVIVWLHGGAYTVGNSHEQEAYWGANLAQLGDVVFCAPNHRLGAFGFSDFSAIGGEKYASSGNVGMLDIVAALEWVRDNIENFGGDPNNVTIIGQSGGGGKVSTLTTMPSAKGLFHKGVVLSGATTMVKLAEQEYSQKRSEYILKEAGLTSSQVDQLQDLPWKEYLAIAQKALDKLEQETGITENINTRFSPVVDGTIVTQHPWLNGASPISENVPMIFCSVFDEQPPSWNNPAVVDITTEKVIEWVAKSMSFHSPGLGDKAPEVVKAYMEAFPGKRPVDILSLILGNRQTTVFAADAKSKQSAPVYIAWFGWNPPLLNGRMGAFHMLDICFWFYNADIMLSYSGGGESPRVLSGNMAKSLVQFMKTGNPNGGGLPDWPKYNSEDGMTMILNDVCEVKSDPDREARRTLPPLV